jgi:putative (di)nucleoside polyphosphate hydrolase
MSSSSTDAPNKEYAPSQYSIDETTGEKWRLCVGAAVLNSHNQLLVGERLGIPNAWQCPQGGVDDAWKGRPKETIFEASSRELFEEMGLEVGTHVLHVVDPSYQHPVEPPVRYRTNGTSTSNWLTKAGFAGQEIHWTVFRCADARGDQDPAAMCDLSGTGGEHAEFSKVQWQDLDEVVATIWETKREPYLALQRMLMLQNETKAAQDDDWQNQMKSLDFGGKWTRESSSSIGLVEALVGRGLTQDEAEDEAKKPYIQSWRRSDETNCTWVVTTYQVDGVTPRRELEYSIGEWEEQYQGQAILFGTSETGTTILKRRTAFVAEPDADPVPMAHVTVTDGPKGVEESRRYLKKDGKFVLRRTLWPKDTPETPIISTEVFVVYS